jgi:ABC-type nitrate/sulfonate/bicarbonate transport system substrate-binding protein
MVIAEMMFLVLQHGMYIASVRKALWLGSAFYLCICTGSVSGEEITVSYASLTAAYMDHIVAIEKGYVLGEGLNVKVMRAGGGTATQTLLSGQLHFSSSAGSALSAALRGGLVKIVYTNMSRPTYRLVSNKPEIKTLQDLVGKKIAINSFGDTGHLATLLLLKKYGLDTKSFLFIAVRNEARFPAFVSGSVDAAPLTPQRYRSSEPIEGSHSRGYYKRGSAGLEWSCGFQQTARGKPSVG